MPNHTEDKNKISLILQKLPVFSGLYPDEYEHIQDICIPTTVEDGETIFVEDDLSPCMYVLLSGEVQLRTSDQGLIYALKPGELFGEIGFISQQRRTATAIASAASAVIKIRGDAFQLLLGRQPRICFIIMRNITLNLSNHIIRMNKTDTLDYLPPETS